MAETSIIHIGTDFSDLKSGFEQIAKDLANIGTAVTGSFNTVNSLFDKTTDAINAQRKEIDVLQNTFSRIGTNVSAGLGGVRNAITKNTTEVVAAVKQQGQAIDRSVRAQTIVIKRLETSFNNLSKTVQHASAENVKAIEGQTKQITQALEKMTSTINATLKQQLDVMQKTAKGLGISLKDATDDGNDGFLNLTGGASRANEVLRRTGDVVALLHKGFEYLRWTITRAFYFGAILQFQTAVTNVAKEGMEYEQQVANLQTVTNGNLRQAVRLYQQINNLADHSTFSVAEMVKTSLILNKSGLSPTVEFLEAMGKFAAGTGQSMFTLATSIANVASSEEEQLKGLQKIGVKAEVIGDKLKVSYKGQVQLIDRSTNALQNYLIALSKSAEFENVMKVQMDGVTGAQKRLSEAWSAFSRQIFFSGGGQFLTRFFEETTIRVNQMIESLQDPKIAAGIGSLGQFAFTVIDSVSTVIGVLKEGFIGLGEIVGRFFEIINIASAGLVRTSGYQRKTFDDMFYDVQKGMDGTKDAVNADMQGIDDKGAETADSIKGNFRATEDDIMSGWTRLFRVLTLGLNTIIATCNALGETLGYLGYKASETFFDDKDRRFSEFLQRKNKEREGKGLGTVSKYMFTDEGDLTTWADRVSKGDTKGLRIKPSEEQSEEAKQARMLMLEFRELEVQRKKLIEEKDPGWLGAVKTNADWLLEQDEKFIRGVQKTVDDSKKVKSMLNDATQNYTGGAGRMFGDSSDFDKINKQLLDKQTSFLDARTQLDIKYKKQSEDLERAIASSKGITQEQANNARKVLEENYQKELTQIQEREGGKRSAGSAGRAKERTETWTRYYEGLLSQAQKNLPKLEQIELSHQKALAELKKQVDQNSNVDHEQILNAKRLIDQQYEEDKKKYAEEAHNFIASLDETGLQKLADNYTKKLEKLKEYHEAGLIAEEEYQQMLAEIRNKYDEDMNKAKDDIAKKTKDKAGKKALEDFWGGKEGVKDMEALQKGLGSISQAFGNLTANMDKNSTAYKALFAVQKSFAFATASIDAINAWIKALNDPTAVTWPQKLANYASAVATTTAAIGQLMSISMHDKGGTISQGQMGIVGEYGPELIRGPATVTSRKDTADLLSNAGANVTVNLIEDASRAGQVQKEQTDEETTISAFVANIRTGGQASSVLEQTYGLQRVGA